MTWELVDSGNEFITSVINGADLVPTFSVAYVDDLRAEVLNWTGAILRPVSSGTRVLGQLKSNELKRSGFGDDYIKSQIKERALARKDRDFSRGDKIRSHLAAKGIALMDVGTETG